jgi:basic amino acid/polyamine antiporter, APA family
VAIGAVTAMLGVLLNLLLGLSRVCWRWRAAATCRLSSRAGRREAVRRRARPCSGRRRHRGLAAIGSVKTTWSFSAFTVLVYYALTNLAALRMPRQARLYPRWIPALGLFCCLGLAFWVEPRIWAAGLALIASSAVALAASPGR